MPEFNFEKLVNDSVEKFLVELDKINNSVLGTPEPEPETQPEAATPEPEPVVRDHSWILTGNRQDRHNIIERAALGLLCDLRHRGLLGENETITIQLDPNVNNHKSFDFQYVSLGANFES